MTSLVWNYFIPRDDNKAECMLCHKMYSRKGRGTTCLRNHLRSMHMPQFSQLQEDELKKTAASFGDKRKIDIKPLIAKALFSESYKLHHNNHLTIVLEALAEDESFMDITLTAQGKAIKAHKSVLSAISPYFRSVLKENPCQHPIIIMPRDIRFEELSNIISYIYKGEMTVGADDLASVLKTAEVLQVAGLSPETTGSTCGITGVAPTVMAGITANIPVHSSPSKPAKKQKVAHTQPRPRLQVHTEGSQNANNNEEAQSFNNNEPQAKIDPFTFLKTTLTREELQAESGSPPGSFHVASTEGGINPFEFLNVDMTCVKEELQSDTEETEDPSFNFSTGCSLAKVSAPSSGGLDSSSDAFQHQPSDDAALGFPSLADDEDVVPSEEETPPSSTSAAPPGRHVCPHCRETHRPNDALFLHLRLKHPSKPSFMCECGMVFVTLALLTNHRNKCQV